MRGRGIGYGEDKLRPSSVTIASKSVGEELAVYTSIIDDSV